MSNAAKLLNAIDQRAAKYRLDRAMMLLERWAFYLYRGTQHIEPESGWSGESIIAAMNTSKGYNPFCFKLLTNAQQTRSAKQSNIPMGGASSQQSIGRYVEQVDGLIVDNFSDHQRLVLFALFVPRSLYSANKDEPPFKDYEIAQQLGVQPKRASYIKQRALKVVISDMLAP